MAKTLERNALALYTVTMNVRLLVVILFSVSMLVIGFFGELKTFARELTTSVQIAEEKVAVTRRAVTEEPLWTIAVGETLVEVEIADTAHERQQGLSGRPSLSTGKGMLFLFPAPDRYGFWMKNVAFPLDILWIARGRVVGIEERVPTVPLGEDPPLYYPAEPVMHVLEVPAGWADEHGIKPGDPFRAIDALPTVLVE